MFSIYLKNERVVQHGWINFSQPTPEKCQERFSGAPYLSLNKGGKGESRFLSIGLSVSEAQT